MGRHTTEFGDEEDEDDEEGVEIEEDGRPRRQQIHIDWHAHYGAMLEYLKEHGHCNVPYLDKYECDLVAYDINGDTFHYYGALGSWLTRQRRYKRGLRGTLTPDREALLQKLVDQGMLKNLCSNIHI